MLCFIITAVINGCNADLGMNFGNGHGKTIY